MEVTIRNGDHAVIKQGTTTIGETVSIVTSSRVRLPKFRIAPPSSTRVTSSIHQRHAANGNIDVAKDLEDTIQEVGIDKGPIRTGTDNGQVIGNVQVA